MCEMCRASRGAAAGEGRRLPGPPARCAGKVGGGPSLIGRELERGH